MELNIDKIYKEMSKLGLNKLQLAKKMEYDHPQYIYEVLKPGRSLTFKTVNKLAKALDVDPRDLIQ